ncbi:MAG: DUF1868 domain-containing protein [Legionella sp.]
MIEKLNSEGKYLTFPGITVVSAINEHDNPLWQLVYNSLKNNQEFTNHFALLPYESYHLTTINLYTKDAIGNEQWKKFIETHKVFFQSLNRTLNENSFKPVISVRSINIAGALQIMVSLPEEQMKTIQRIAKTHHVEAGIPSVFHITLAYQFKLMKQEALEKLGLALEEIIVTALKNHKGELCLSPSKLCFFNDMTKFIPWNGDEYPFAENTVNSNLFFVKQDTSKENASSGVINSATP